MPECAVGRRHGLPGPDALMELALSFEATLLAQIRRHYQSIAPNRDGDGPGQLELVSEDPPLLNAAAIL